MTYTWTDNPMVDGVSTCEPDVVNDNLMWLKYNAGGGVVDFDNKGTVTTNITLAQNKITTGYWSGTNTITLPTITDTNKQVTCELWFTTATSGQPTITNTNLKWDADDGGKAPAAYSILSGVINVFRFKSYFEGATQKWAAEYTTFGGIETAFTAPVLTSNTSAGTVGGSGYAVSANPDVSGTEIYKAFDGNGTTRFASGATTGSFIIYSSTPIKIANFYNTAYTNSAFLTDTIYGSNDGTNYTVLASLTGLPQVANQTLTIPSGNLGFYKYYKHNYTGSNAISSYTITHDGVYIAS